MKTREELTEYLTVIIFNASAQHAAVNFGQVSGRADMLHTQLSHTAGNSAQMLCKGLQKSFAAFLQKSKLGSLLRYNVIFHEIT